MRIVTDAGSAYIKAMGNRQGPHPLACEWVATNLAKWFGLTTFAFAIMEIDAEFDEIPFFHGGMAASGPAFVTRSASGHTWGGSKKELKSLVNEADVSKLVVFDTWVRNCDRYPPDLTVRGPNFDNVFLEDVSGKLRLIAMDHSHCFSCGRDLDDRLAHIDSVKDDQLYGLFPAFEPLIREKHVEVGIARLKELEQKIVSEIVETIPDEWKVTSQAALALTDFVYRRAEFIAETVLKPIGRRCWPNRLFDKRN